MKRIFFILYTIFRILWLPIAFAIPIITIEQTSAVSYEMNFPIVVIIPLMIIEIILRKKYRKDFSRLSTKYWLVTAFIGWGLTVAALVLALPGMPLHKDFLTQPANNVQSGNVIAISIIWAALIEIILTLPEIISRKKTIGLYKKEELFK
jgi:hypothetical protein